MEIDWSRWAKPTDNRLANDLKSLCEGRRQWYRESRQAENDFRQVKQIAEGDYKKRQVIELVQNAVDAIGDEHGPCPEGGRVKMVLTPFALYCANEGEPFTGNGFESLTYGTGTGKDREDTIGRFGLGFRSVTAVTQSPEIYSTSLSVRFNLEEAEKFFRQGDWRYPGQPINLLAYPIPVDPEECAKDDHVLLELMAWATSVIKLPFDPDNSSYAQVLDSMKNFEEQFLLFCRNVKELEFDIHLENQLATERSTYGRKVTEVARAPKGASNETALQVERVRLTNRVAAGDQNWVIFTNRDVHVPESVNQGEKIERRLDRNGDPLPVVLSWALNLDLFKQGAQGQPKGRFWFYFPIPENQPSLAGIANAPWLTNQGRTRVLDPADYPFNRAVLEALQGLVFSALPELLDLCDEKDPGRYLDILPSRSAEEDDSTKMFVRELWKTAAESAHPSIVDLDKRLRLVSEMYSYPPEISNNQANEWVRNATCDWAEASPIRDLPHPALIATGGRVATLRYLMTGSEERV